LNVTLLGHAGFRFCDDQAWLNSFLFPIARDQFVKDLNRIGFEGRSHVMNPGDVFEINGDSVTIHPQASGVVQMLEDDTTKIQFDPTAPVPALIDRNPDRYTMDKLIRITHKLLADDMIAYARAGYDKSNNVINLYRRHRFRYIVALVFPEGEIGWYRFDFTKDMVSVQNGMGVAEETDMAHQIVASALVDWIDHKKSFFYLRAHSRRYQNVCDMSSEDGKVRVKPLLLPDLLMHFLLNEAVGSETAAKDQVDFELKAIRSEGVEA